MEVIPNATIHASFGLRVDAALRAIVVEKATKENRLVQVGQQNAGI